MLLPLLSWLPELLEPVLPEPPELPVLPEPLLSLPWALLVPCPVVLLSLWLRELRQLLKSSENFL